MTIALPCLALPCLAYKYKKTKVGCVISLSINYYMYYVSHCETVLSQFGLFAPLRAAAEGTTHTQRGLVGREIVFRVSTHRT